MSVFFLALLILAALFECGAAQAQSPRVTIATHDEGSPFHQIAQSLASMIGDQMNMEVELRPHERWDRYIGRIDAGEIDFGFVVGIDAGAAYRGKAGEEPLNNLRTVTRLWSIRYTYLSRAVLGVRNYVGLRGRRVGLAIENDATMSGVNLALLKTVALGPTDIRTAPLPSFSAGIERLISGQLEVVPVVVGLPQVARARTSIPGGVRYVSLFGPNATTDFLADQVPGLYVVTVQPDTRLPEIVEPIVTAAFDVFLVTHRNVPDALAGGVAGVLHRNFPALAQRHAVMRTSTQTEVGAPTNAVPYHPGVIAYYRSRGLWTQENDNAEARLTRP